MSGKAPAIRSPPPDPPLNHSDREAVAMFSKRKDLETLQGKLLFCKEELECCDAHLAVLAGYLWERQDDHAALVLRSVTESLLEVLEMVEGSCFQVEGTAGDLDSSGDLRPEQG